jgi:hypothetical protein
MAYLREFGSKCQRCSKPATVELLNRFNAPCGKFCKKCGERARAEMERKEKG